MKISELNDLKAILKSSFIDLIKNDDDLIHLTDNNQPDEALLHDTEHERKLHEVCINHRLAIYLENHVKHLGNGYKADIEYNRYYSNFKYVKIDDKPQIRRPDIIVHTRAEKNQYQQHYLVIEAKKDKVDPKDEKTIISFIKEPKYRYKFGLTVVYYDFNPIKGKLYYIDEGILVTEALEYRR